MIFVKHVQVLMIIILFICEILAPLSITLKTNPDYSSKSEIFSDKLVTIQRYPKKPRSMENTFIFIKSQGDRIFKDPKLIVNIKVELNAELNITTIQIQEPGNTKVVVYTYIPNNIPVSNAYVRVKDLVLNETVAAGFTNEEGVISFTINTTKLGCCKLRPHRIEAFYDLDKNGLYDYFNSITILIGSRDVYINLYLKGIKEFLNIALDSWSLSYEIPLIPLSSKFYISCIPGLPTFKTTLRYKSSLFREPLILSLSSYVKYKIYINNYEYEDNYMVIERKFKDEKKPLIIMLNNNIDALNSISELTLSPLSTPNNLSLKIIALDNLGIADIRFEYSVNNSSWIYVGPQKHELMKYLEAFYTKVNEEIINSIENSLKQLIQLSIPRIKTPLGIYTIVLSNLNIGTFVKYRARAKDIYGNIAMSFTGLCYIYNSSSSVKVLIIDPHVKLQLIQENAKYLKEFIALAESYGITNEFLTLYTEYIEISKLIHKYRSIHFHHWEYLGEKYQIKIVEPNEYVIKELQSYKPDVIILSDLYLGLNKFNSLNWDLTMKTYNNNSILKYLLNYIRENHVGLIATHGTLCEFSLLLNDTMFKIFSEGYIAPDLNDVSLIVHESLANALGLSLLSLYKYVKNQVTYVEDKYLAPLQILWVPWNGSLIPTSNTQTLGWYIPSEPITIPNPYMHIGSEFRAYTQVGWQLGFNTSIMDKALINTIKYRDFIANNYNDLLQLIIRNTNIRKYDKDIFTIINLSIINTIPLFQNIFSNMNVYDDSIIINTSQIYIKIPLTKQLLKSIVDSQTLRIIAISPDYKAGIIAYDKYWDFEYGYRAIYFSFEIEAGMGNAAKILLQQAVEWCNNWRPVIGLSEQIGDYIRIPKYDANKLREFIRDLGGIILRKTTIISELGTTKLDIEIHNVTSLKMIIVTPDRCDLNINSSRTLKLLEIKELTSKVKVLTFKPLKNGLHIIELNIKGAERTLIPIFIEIRSPSRISGITKYISVVSRTIAKTPYLGEEIEIILRKVFTNITCNSCIKDLIIYEIIPQGFKVIKADGRVIKTSFGNILETLIPLELRDMIIRYIRNLDDKFYEYIPSSTDKVTLIKFSLANLNKVTYRIKAIDLTKKMLIAGSILVVKTPKEYYIVPGLVIGDNILEVKPPKFTEIKFQEPDELQAIINIKELEKFGNATVHIYVPQRYANLLRQLTILLPKTLHKEVIIQLDLETVVSSLQHRDLIIAIINKITKSSLSIHVQNSSELPRTILMKFKPNLTTLPQGFINIFPIIIFEPNIRVKKLITISFNYTEKILETFNVDEENIRIALYNSSSDELIELITNISPEINIISAQTKYIDSLIVMSNQAQIQAITKSLTTDKQVNITELMLIIIMSIAIMFILIIVMKLRRS